MYITVRNVEAATAYLVGDNHGALTGPCNLDKE